MNNSIKQYINNFTIEDANLKRDIFSLLLNSTIIVAFSTFFLSLLLMKNYVCISVNVLFLAFLFILYFAGKKDASIFMQKKLYVTYCFFNGCFFMPLMYVFGGGIHSGAPLIFMIIGVSTILLLDHSLLIITLALNFSSALITYYVDYANIISVEKYTSLGDMTYVDIAVSTVLVGFAIGLFLRKLTKIFEDNQNQANDLLGRIENMATKDPLSGAYNRRYLMSTLEKYIKQVDNNKLNAFSIIMFDIDHFKEVNDKYGHLAGDDCIKNLVYIIKSSLRDVDTVTRYGGEEFIAVLPTAEDTPAFRRAEQIRVTVENTRLSADIEKVITVSAGVAMYKPGMTSDDLVALVDRNLYIAKQSGRNQVVWHEGGIPPLVYNAFQSNDLQPVQNSGRRFSDATKF